MMGIIPEKLAVARTFAKELQETMLDDCTDFPFLVHANAHRAAHIIEKLCSEIEQLQNERDAAVEVLKQFECSSCIHEKVGAGDEPCVNCIHNYAFGLKGQRADNWQLRGVEVAN